MRLFRRPVQWLILCCLITTSEQSPGRVLSIENFGAVPDERSGFKMTDPEDGHLLEDLEELVKKIQSGDSQYKSIGGDVKKFICNDLGPKPNNDGDIALKNTRAFNKTLEMAQPGDTVLVPEGKEYRVFGGIIAVKKKNITIDIAGSLNYIFNLTSWPRRSPFKSSIRVNDSRYDAGLSLWKCQNVKVTSSATNKAKLQVGNDLKVSLVNPTELYGGMLNGNGLRWWFEALFSCFKEDPDWNRTNTSNPRPRLLYVMESEDILVEHLTLINSPYWTFSFETVGGEASDINVLVDADVQRTLIGHVQALSPRRKGIVNIWDRLRGYPYRIASEILEQILGHDPLALNTDGIDPIGANISIHDGIISCSDDTVAVKPSYSGRGDSIIPDCTNNVVVKDMILTGFGASIGSVPPKIEHNCVDNVHFHNITMPKTGRGIYIKADGSECTPDDNGNVPSAQISNIVYSDVVIQYPYWWPVWIGPQQQQQPGSDRSTSFKCSLFFPFDRKCPVPSCATFENITLRGIDIQYSKGQVWPWVGAIMGNSLQPMKNIEFHKVKANPMVNSRRWWLPNLKQKYLRCEDASGSSLLSEPVPKCLVPPKTRSRTGSTKIKMDESEEL